MKQKASFEADVGVVHSDSDKIVWDGDEKREEP